MTTTAWPTGPRPDGETDLERRLAGWVDRGLVTAEQAAAIQAAEASLPGEPAPRADHRPRPGSLVGEALGYVGGARQTLAPVDRRRQAVGLAVAVAAGAIAAVLARGLG